MLRLNPTCPRGIPVADLVHLDAGHTHHRSLTTTTAGAALTEVTAAKAPHHRTATVTEALAANTMMTGHRAIVHLLADQWKITRPLEVATMSLTAAIILLLLPILMQMAVDLPMTGRPETFLPGSQHTLEKEDMRETTIVVDATGKFTSSLFFISISLRARAVWLSFPKLPVFIRLLFHTLALLAKLALTKRDR
jgi:hypothetical protein